MNSQFVDIIIKPIKQNGLSYLLSQFVNSTLFPQSKLNELWLTLLNFINVVQKMTNEELVQLYEKHGVGNNPSLFDLLPSSSSVPPLPQSSALLVELDAQNPLDRHRVELDKKYQADQAEAKKHADPAAHHH